MNENTQFWQITEFSQEVSRKFKQVSGIEETIHFNTIDKWFKSLEKKGIHYVQRSLDKKVYDELDLNIAVYMMKMRKEKWQLEAIIGILSSHVDLRKFPKGVESDHSLVTSDGQVMMDMQRKFKKLEESLIEQFKQQVQELKEQMKVQVKEQVNLRIQEIESTLLNKLTASKTEEQVRAERTDQMISSARFRMKLEEDGMTEWNKKSEDERTKKVGLLIKRVEEDLTKRDQFVRSYVQESLIK